MDKNGIPGFLRYDTKIMRLELIGTFEDDNQSYLISRTQMPRERVIYGFSDCGEKFTLCNCIMIGATFCAPGFDTIAYNVHHFYAGTQLFNDETDNLIKNCTFSLTYLDAWFDSKNIKPHTDNDTNVCTLSIDMNKSNLCKDIKINFENLLLNEEIQYNVHYPKEYYSNEVTEIEISRFYKVSLIDEKCMSYNDCINYLKKISRLLTLLIGSPLYFSYIDLNLKPIERMEPDGEEWEQENSCRVFFRQVGEINKKQNISPHLHNSLLISRKDILDNIDDIFSKWFSQQELISEIINPFISDLYLPSFLETKFLNVIRGIETYHRCFIMKKDEALMEPSALALNEDRKRIKFFIQKEISESNRNYFIERIDYEDEESLYRRLKEVLNNIPEELMHKMFGELNSEKKDKLIQKVVQTRNYLTHRDNKEKYLLAIDDTSALDNYIEKLGVILQYLILKQIGVNSDIVVKRLLKFSKNSFAFNTN